MATTHIVKRGENLPMIAKKYGFHDWKTIYDHSNNREFRKKRPNPNLILPGDQLFIPDKTAVPKPKVEFHLSVKDKLSGNNFPNLTLQLVLPTGITKQYLTDSSGVIDLKEPEVIAGKVDIQQIWDETEEPRLSYNTYAQLGLATETSNVLRVLNKRKIINDIVSKHAVIRRSFWGKRKPNYLAMAEDWDYNTVVLHHSGDGGEKDPVEIETKHMGERRWDDVGYHYLITPDGKIYEGRYLALKGSHVEGANTGKVGILIMGDFEHQWWDSDDDPTTSQLTVAESLIKTLKGVFPTVTKLGGHRDYKADTKCPGGDLYKKIPDLRVKTSLSGP